MVISLSVSFGRVHLPSCPFVAVNCFGFPLGSVYEISSISASSFAGLVVTLPSSLAFAFGALSFSSTVSAWLSWPVFLFSPSPWLTVTAPSSETSILASAGRLGFASLIAAITLSFSSFVRFLAFVTGVFAGGVSFIVLSVSLTFSTVCSPDISLFIGFPSPSVPIGTVTLPSASTWISSAFNPRSGLAAITSSLTAFLSVSVSFVVSDTLTLFLGGFKVLSALVNGFTVSSLLRFPVFLPSALVTVTLPLSSTSTLSPSARLFFVLTALATASLSSCVKLVGSLTSTFSGASSLRMVSFWTTVLSAEIVPILPPWLIDTLPSGLTVISLSSKFLSGLASLIACLTACFSVSDKPCALSTLTGSFGGLKLFSTCFWVTTSSLLIAPSWSPFLTLTLPSSETIMSSGFRPRSGFAFITASLILSFSSDVRFLRSFTSIFSSGFFRFSGSSAFFSQTA